MPRERRITGCKQKMGVWMPACETRLVEIITRKNTSYNGMQAYQLEKLEAAVAYCSSLRVAVDVGAHVGLWSRVLADKFAHVVAFEPLPQLCDCFGANVSAANVSLHRVALGDRATDVRITVHPATTLKSHIADDGVSVRQLRLDDFDIRHLDFLKIDCEGYELFVLQGACRTIEAWRPIIIVEQKPGVATRRYGLPERGAIAWLEDHGYETAEELNGDFICVPEVI